MSKVKILVTNTKCKIITDPDTLDELIDDFKIKTKGYFFSSAWRDRTWDGRKPFITNAGYFEAGLLPKVLERCRHFKIKAVLEDQRQHFDPDEYITQVGSMILRPYQLAAKDAVMENEVMGLPFRKGILYEAVNAGKSLIAASIFLSFPEDTTWFFFVHRKLLHGQLVKELTEMLPGEVGVIDSTTYYLKRFNICMISSLANRIKDRKLQAALAKADGCLIDECHRAATKQYKLVLQKTYNSPVRIGLSGTPFLNKDPIKREEILQAFGPVIHKITTEELVDLGFSTPPVVKIIMGETRYSMPKEYKAEYDKIITNNKRNGRRVWKRVMKNLAKGRCPALIFCKYIPHAKNMLKWMPKELKGKYKIGIVHSQMTDGAKTSTLNAFKSGELDILIGTHLIAEGHNMPLIKYSVNCGGSDSGTTINQYVGRMLRTHKTKKKVYIDDIFYMGYYQRRHSKHRVLFYKAEKFEVRELHKITAKRKGIRL